MLIFGRILLKETQPRTLRWQQALKVISFLKTRCLSLFQIFFQFFFFFFFVQSTSLLTREQAKNKKHCNLQQALLVFQDWNLTSSEIKRYIINYDSHFAINHDNLLDINTENNIDFDKEVTPLVPIF